MPILHNGLDKWLVLYELPADRILPEILENKLILNVISTGLYFFSLFLGRYIFLCSDLT